jgi:hypothetical protein
MSCKLRVLVSKLEAKNSKLNNNKFKIANSYKWQNLI